MVLSACQTGIGSVGNGDELIGMSRALLFAGARSFVLSRWKVDAASTALWMQTFHAEAQRQPLGEAARRAIVAVRPIPPLPIPIIGRRSCWSADEPCRSLGRCRRPTCNRSACIGGPGP